MNIYFPPFEQKFQGNVTRERSYSNQGQMLTKDENIVEVPVTVQYRVSDLKNFALNVDNPEQSLQHATESALRHVAGSTTMDEILTSGREQMAVDVQERLQKYMQDYETGISINQVNIRRAAAPEAVQEAFDDVIRAREDQQREINQAQTYANGVVPEARGKATRIIEEANGYKEEIIAKAEGESNRFEQLRAEYEKAPEVTRKRLYLETMNNVLNNTSKILVTGQQGQNNLLYLPLDKMMENSKSNSSGGVPQSNTTNTKPSNPQISGVTAQPDPRVRESR